MTDSEKEKVLSVITGLLIAVELVKKGIKDPSESILDIIEPRCQQEAQDIFEYIILAPESLAEMNQDPEAFKLLAIMRKNMY